MSHTFSKYVTHSRTFRDAAKYEWTLRGCAACGGGNLHADVKQKYPAAHTCEQPGIYQFHNVCTTNKLSDSVANRTA